MNKIILSIEYMLFNLSKILLYTRDLDVFFGTVSLEKSVLCGSSVSLVDAKDSKSRVVSSKKISLMKTQKYSACRCSVGIYIKEVSFDSRCGFCNPFLNKAPLFMGVKNNSTVVELGCLVRKNFVDIINSMLCRTSFITKSIVYHQKWVGKSSRFFKIEK